MKRDWKWAMDRDLKILHDSDLFDEMLDDCYEPIKIAGYEYACSLALKEVDPTAYRCGMADYIDELQNQGEVTQLDDGTLVYTADLEDIEEQSE